MSNTGRSDAAVRVFSRGGGTPTHAVLENPRRDQPPNMRCSRQPICVTARDARSCLIRLQLNSGVRWATKPVERHVPSASTKITLAILHFAQPTRFPSSAVQWTLWPEGRQLRRAELCATLDAMPKPVVVSAHAEQGGLTAVPLANAAPDSQGWLEHEYRNQRAYFSEKLDSVLPGARNESVLLELDDGELVVLASDLATWTEEYIVTSCGWTLSRNVGDSRAPLRMLLRRPDGYWSPGTAHRPPNPERPGRSLTE
jgi:hypothetical protein